MIPLNTSHFEAIKSSYALPSPKGPALAIIRLTQKEDVALAELARTVSTDPAFVSRLIKAANSAQAAGRRPVVAVMDALSVLGIATVRSLALGFSLISDYGAGACRGFNYDRFWSGSLMTAIAMQALAKQVRIAPPDETFCLGLLSRIGHLGLATIFPEPYAELLDAAYEGDALTEAEINEFSISRDQLSVAMLVDWGFPRQLVEPVYFIDAPDKAPYEDGSRTSQVTWGLALAAHVAAICLAPESEWRSMMPRLFLLGGRLGLEAEALMALCDATVKEWQEWGTLLSVKTVALPPFEDMSKPPAAPRMDAGMLVAGGEEGYRMRVLVVDDERSMRALVSAVLRQAGHEVIEAADGQQGFEMAIEMRPQIMIVDWMMPGMNGIELVRALRETAVGRAIYILLLTAIEDDEALVEAFNSGADDFMTKPLRPKVLAARLRAGQRVIKLQQEVERDRENIRRFAVELAVTNSKLQQVALTDFLTGFPNRRYAMSRLQQEWASALRSGHDLACMVVDVDTFKQINDSYGHDVGDAVLRHLAVIFREAVRAEDVICRMGGDEFLVICPNSSLDAALSCAHRLRDAVTASQVVVGSLTLGISISIGVAERDPGMTDVEAMIKRADESVYLAKARGRNCVVALQAPG